MSNYKDLELTIKGVRFPHPVMTGGGVFKTADELVRYASSDVIPEWGSIETEPSSGNGGRDYHAHYVEVGGERVLMWTQNSLGIPNPGMAYVEGHAKQVIHRYANEGKPVAINVSGKSIDDTIELAYRAVAAGFPIVTINGSCPNKAGERTGSLPILCFDAAAVFELVVRLDARIGDTPSVILWKVSPGMPRPTLLSNCSAIARSKCLTGIITGNTVPATLDYLPDGATTIATGNGISEGGLAGPAILPMALSSARAAAKALPAEKLVVGTGGITGAKEAKKYFAAGATLVQVVSGFLESNRDPLFVSHMLVDLLENGVES